jgi:hypothetical protein
MRRTCAQTGHSTWVVVGQVASIPQCIAPGQTALVHNQPVYAPTSAQTPTPYPLAYSQFYTPINGLDEQVMPTFHRAYKDNNNFYVINLLLERD